ncbi:hypothetical protein [Lapidilactobacillus salsurivasis]
MSFRKAQSDAHSELTPNFAAQAAAIITNVHPELEITSDCFMEKQVV